MANISDGKSRAIILIRTFDKDGRLAPDRVFHICRVAAFNGSCFMTQFSSSMIGLQNDAEEFWSTFFFRQKSAAS